MIGISEYYLVVFTRDTWHHSYASIQTFRPLKDIYHVENISENVIVLYLKPCKGPSGCFSLHAVVRKG